MDKILFFDGVCVMCNGLVDFVLKHDQKRVFKFATLQGKTAKARIPEFANSDLNTVVLLDEAGTHTESDAIIRLLIGMGGVFGIANILKIFPKKLRDAVYRWVASNRYRWFGKTESCRLLTKEEKGRIID